MSNSLIDNINLLETQLRVSEFDEKVIRADERERICLNYGIEQEKIKAGKDIGKLINAMKESYPMSKAEYVDFDVFLNDVMRKFSEVN